MQRQWRWSDSESDVQRGGASSQQSTSTRRFGGLRSSGPRRAQSDSDLPFSGGSQSSMRQQPFSSSGRMSRGKGMLGGARSRSSRQVVSSSDEEAMQQQQISGGGFGRSRSRWGGQDQLDFSERDYILEDLVHDHYRDVVHGDLAKKLIVDRNYSRSKRQIVEALLDGEISAADITKNDLLNLLVEDYACDVAYDTVAHILVCDRLENREHQEIMDDLQAGKVHYNHPKEFRRTMRENARLDAKLASTIDKFLALQPDLGAAIVNKYFANGIPMKAAQSPDFLKKLHCKIAEDILSYFEEYTSECWDNCDVMQSCKIGGMKGGGTKSGGRVSGGSSSGRLGRSVPSSV